jgi:DNA-directed RNA polymerase specialized sigma24 family protein
MKLTAPSKMRQDLESYGLARVPELVIEALGTLPYRQLQAVYYCDIMSTSVKDAAGLMATTPSNVRVLRHLARKAIRSYLERQKDV